MHTIDYVKNAAMDVLMVIGADKLDNIRSIRADYEKLGEKLWSRFNAPKSDQKWYYTSISDALLKRNPKLHLFKELRMETRKVFRHSYTRTF